LSSRVKSHRGLISDVSILLRLYGIYYASQVLNILDLAENPLSAYESGITKEQIADLVASSSNVVQAADQFFSLGQGTWEVFYAPHIVNLSKPVGVRFSPIRYSLVGDAISSNVRYDLTLFGRVFRGWLSASGTMASHHQGESVKLEFTQFWVDQDDNLRPNLTEASSSLVDRIITAMGRPAFIPPLAIFPVLYLDQDLCVFKFPPLSTEIAVRRIRTLPAQRIVVEADGGPTPLP